MIPEVTLISQPQGRLRYDGHCHARLYRHVLDSSNAETSLPHHHYLDRHLCRHVLLRHGKSIKSSDKSKPQQRLTISGHRSRYLLPPYPRHPVPQARPRHPLRRLPPGLLGSLRRLVTYHSSPSPRPFPPRRSQRWSNSHGHGC